MQRHGRTTRITKAQRQIGGKLYHGRRLAITLVGTVQTMEIYTFPHHPEGTRVLVFQDTPKENGKQSKEADQALALFTRSLVDTTTRD